MTTPRCTVRVLLAALACLAWACASSTPPTPYVDTSADFTGPTVEATASDTFTLTAPTGGWELVLDQVIRDRHGVRAFATLTRPPADAMTTQALEPHALTIPGASGRPTALYIRTLEADQKRPRAVPYRLAATTTPRP